MPRSTRARSARTTDNGTESKRVIIKWTEVLLAILALLSFSFNVYQFVFAQELDSQNKLLASENTGLDNELKEMQIIREQYDLKADVEARYIIINNQSLYNFFGTHWRIVGLDAESGDNTRPKSLLANKVISDFEEHIDKIIQVCSCQPSDLSEADGSGRIIVHGLALYRIQNRGKVIIDNVELVIRWKDFPNEPYTGDNLTNEGPDIWNLRDSVGDWQQSSIRLPDLKPGEEIVIPLAHILGTNRYFGRVMIPESMSWENSVLNTVEKTVAGEIVPSDEWLYKTEQGETIIIAQ
jgi:hypothetical protein